MDRWQQRATEEEYQAQQEVVRREVKLALHKEWSATQSSEAVEGKAEVKAEKAQAKAEKAEAKAQAKAEKAEAKAQAKAEKAEAEEAESIAVESSAGSTDDASAESTSGRHRAPGPASGPGGVVIPQWLSGAS